MHNDSKGCLQKHHKVLYPVPLVLCRAVSKDTDMLEGLATNISVVVRHKNIKLTEKNMMASLTEMKKI